MKLKITGLQSEMQADDDFIFSFSDHLDDLNIVLKGLPQIDSDPSGVSDSAVKLDFHNEGDFKFAHEALTKEGYRACVLKIIAINESGQVIDITAH